MRKKKEEKKVGVKNVLNKEKKLGATFVFDVEDLEDITNLSVDVMTFDSFYKTYLAINKFCIENDMEYFFMVLFENSLNHKEQKLETLPEKKAKTKKQKAELEKIFNSI
jgi:hypothetical protein